MRRAWLLLLASCSPEAAPAQAGSTYVFVEGRSAAVVDSLLALKTARGTSTYRRLVTPRVQGYCVSDLNATEFPLQDRVGLLASSPPDVLWWPQVDVRSAGLTLGLGPETGRSGDGDLNALSEELRVDLTRPARVSIVLEGFQADPAGISQRALALLSDAGGTSLEWTYGATGSEVRPERLRAIGATADQRECVLPGGVRVLQVLEPDQRQVVIRSGTHPAWLRAVLAWTTAAP